MPATDLIIIGAGAAGLMAGVAAGERGLRTIILESRPKPGRKLLMCGNNRCNITSDLPARTMLADYGEPVGAFLETAINAFPPAALREWCHRNGLPTKVQRDKRVYPETEKAGDVHHMFTDLLAKHGVGLMINCPVQSLAPKRPDGWTVQTDIVDLSARYVLVATGGVSYPKTGSVGDGQKMASALGHKVTPYRPGLAGFDMPSNWLVSNSPRVLEMVTLTIKVDGKVIATTRGALEIETYGIGGPAVFNASRIVARRELRNYTFEVDHGSTHMTLHPVRPRPLKEAMVTIGGVSLNDVDPRTMESKRTPGLFFAGEVLDIDGPSGGYNLQAAFSTARLAVSRMANLIKP